jgi:hypothetical protein
MSDYGLFLGFGAPRPGREVQASKVFGEVMAYYMGLKESGEVENVEVAILEVHGGDLGGFILLRGNQEQLGRVRASAEFQRHLLRGGFAVEHVGVVSALLDGEAARFVGEANSITADLT